MSLIEIEDLTFSYASQQHEPALRNLSCSIEQGSFVGITGLAEAGKSSFYRLIAGYIPQFFHGAFSGRVNVAGTDTGETTIGELAERVGFVFENPFDQLTGASLMVLEEAAVEIQHPLVVIYGCLSLLKLPQAEGQPLTSTHIGAGLQDAPEIAPIFLDVSLPSARSPASTPLW
jgi:ABC-type phosphate/phosphonate transport system ATPase subunit